MARSHIPDCPETLNDAFASEIAQCSYKEGHKTKWHKAIGHLDGFHDQFVTIRWKVEDPNAV